MGIFPAMAYMRRPDPVGISQITEKMAMKTACAMVFEPPEDHFWPPASFDRARRWRYKEGLALAWPRGRALPW